MKYFRVFAVVFLIFCALALCVSAGMLLLYAPFLVMDAIGLRLPDGFNEADAFLLLMILLAFYYWPYQGMWLGLKRYAREQLKARSREAHLQSDIDGLLRNFGRQFSIYSDSSFRPSIRLHRALNEYAKIERMYDALPGENILQRRTKTTPLIWESELIAIHLEFEIYIESWKGDGL